MRLNPRSLRGRLLSITLQVLAGGLLLISILFFINTHHEIDELFDAQLAQMARMLVDVEPGSVARHEQDIIPEHRHEYERKIGFAMFDRQGKLIHHSSEVVVTQRPDPCRGFRNQKIDGQRWRLFCYQHPESGEFVVAWQSHHIRNELAGQIVGSILLPLAFGLPLLALMIWWSSGKVLSPVTHLSQQIAQRTPRDLAPIESEDTPTEIVPIIDTLNQLLGRMNLALENERRFTADAAHELRTPLAALRIQIEVAQAQFSDTPIAALNKALQAVDRAVSLVDALLQLARLDDISELELQPTDLQPLIEAATAEHELQAQQCGISLICDTSTSPQVAASPELLRILLRNLLDNALKYTQSGGQVNIRCGDRYIEVADNGPGIEPEQRIRLQQRFARGRDVASTGHGLGLSIAARICELHHAQLSLDWAESGQGLLVRVVFPGHI